MKQWLGLGSMVACVHLCFKIIMVLGKSCIVRISGQNRENCMEVIMIVQDKTSWLVLCE